MDRTTRRLIALILGIIVIILINVASTTLFARADLTASNVYSLSRASKDTVATLEEPLTIKAFFSPNLPAPYNNIEQSLRDLLEEYAIAGNEFFNYEIITVPSKETTQGETSPEEEEARRYRVYPIQIQNVQQDEVKLQTAYMGIAIIHGDMLENLSAATSGTNLEYQITNVINDMSKKISALLSMRENIDVTLVLSENLNALSSALKTLPRELETAVEDLNNEYYGRLNFDYVDPIAEGITDVQQRYGAPPLTLRRGDESTEVAYAGVVLNRGDERYNIDIISRGIFGLQIPDAESIKETIASVADSLIGIQEEIGFMTGYGAPSLDGQSAQQATSVETDLGNFDTLVSQEYNLREIDLDTERIPDGLHTLVVVAPSAKLSDFALFQLDQFVLRGNNLVLFLDSHTVFMPQTSQYGGSQEPVYIPRNTGLEALIEHYGLELRKAYVLDEQSYVQRQQGTQGGVVEMEIYFAPIIGQNERNNDLPYLKNLPDMVGLNMSPVYPTADVADSADTSNVQATMLFSTSTDGWTMEGDNINLNNPYYLTPPVDEDQQSIPMAYRIDGTFQSFFSGRDIPEPPEQPNEGDQADMDSINPDLIDMESARANEGTGTVVVIGGSAMIGSNVLDAEGRTGNAIFVLNLLDELSGRGDYAVMRTKGSSYEPLDDTTASFRNFMKLFNIAGLPIIVALIGIGVWLVRGTRKRAIEAQFSGRTGEKNVR